MLRTVFTIGLFALLGLFLLKLAFGIFGVLFAILISLFFVALKIALVGFVIYLLIRIFSPDTARRLRQRWSGSTGM